VSDFTVGQVSFSPPSAEAEFYRGRNAALEAENAELIRRVNRLTWVLERCVPADNTIANERLRALERDQ
jgi:hypothetical protein